MQYREELLVKLNESSVSVEWLVGSYSGILVSGRKGKSNLRKFPTSRNSVSLETDSSYELTKADVCGWKKIYISAEFV